MRIASALGQYRALIEIKDARFTEELREENFMMRLRYMEQRRRFPPQFSAELRNARCAAYSCVLGDDGGSGDCGYQCRRARNKRSRQVDIARNSKAESYLAMERFGRCCDYSVTLFCVDVHCDFYEIYRNTSVISYWNFILERARECTREYGTSGTSCGISENFIENGKRQKNVTPI